MFWTVILPADSVAVDLAAGTAVLEVHDIHLEDYFDFENSVIGPKPPAPARASFRVEWEGFGAVNVYDNAAQKFRGEFLDASARMEFSARTPDFDFLSAAIDSSTSVAAELGQESNGSFY